MKRIELWLFVVGLLLLVLGAAMHSPSGLSRDDAGEAFRDFARIPLDQLAKAAGTAAAVTIPETEQWARIRRAWGDPGYIIAAVSPPQRNLVYCFANLGITVWVTRGAGRVPLEAASDWPYGYSTECWDNGVRFHAAPGSKLTIRAVATPTHPLPPGELVVRSYWSGEAKDRLVGVSLDEDLQKMSKVPFAMGLVLIVCSAFLLIRHRLVIKRPTD